VTGWLRLVVPVVLIALAVAAVAALRSHWVGLGSERVQQRWSAQVADDTAAAATHTAELQRLLRADETRKQLQAERIAHENALREKNLRVRVERAGARNRSLLDTIAALNAASAVPGAGADAGTATVADGGADIARELLGQCSSRYTAVAADADRYADQVTGLQGYAALCRAGAP